MIFEDENLNTAIFENASKNAENETKRSKGNWKQRLIQRRFSADGKDFLLNQKIEKTKTFKKSLLYVFFLKKILSQEATEINYLNLTLLKIFLTKYSKIKARRNTRVNSKTQRQISKAIRRSRVEGLLPFVNTVVLTRPSRKKELSFKSNELNEF